MAYRVDRPEAFSDVSRLERWANNNTEQLIFALNDIDYRLRKHEETLKAITEMTDRLTTPSQEIYDLKQELEQLGSSVDTIQSDYTALELRVQALEGE